MRWVVLPLNDHMQIVVMQNYLGRPESWLNGFQGGGTVCRYLVALPRFSRGSDGDADVAVSCFAKMAQKSFPENLKESREW